MVQISHWDNHDDQNYNIIKKIFLVCTILLPLFLLFSVFLCNKQHPLNPASSVVWTHDLLIMSRLPLPLDQCFPKSGPRTIFGPLNFLFWSARKKDLHFLPNKVTFYTSKYIFMVRRTIFNDFVVRQNIFQCFMVRKLKKFGKHCTRPWPLAI
jgi:hypothetical protein